MSANPKNGAVLDRATAFSAVNDRRGPVDLVVIGGGATGAGVALDAALRGLSVVLLEAYDFGKGTSSRSTKLVHGGLRYLAQGRVGLVREALRERAWLCQAAPHVVHPLAFVMPARSRLEQLKYRVGVQAYDWLALGHGLGASGSLDRAGLGHALPGLAANGFRGGVRYFDAAFDDSRLLIDIVISAVRNGAVALNYAPVTGLLKSADGKLRGVAFRDNESGADYEIEARMVVNAAGAFADAVNAFDEAPRTRQVQCSRGTHIVLDRAFLPADNALIIPETHDGRVMFAIPWMGRVLIGTTDVATPAPTIEPTPSAAEVDDILQTVGAYLERQPRREDIRTAFAGIRPLAAPDHTGSGTASTSREHAIRVAASGLVTITGGKWTTFRVMARECMDRAIAEAGIAAGPARTADLRFSHVPADPAQPLSTYGDAASAVATLAAADADLAAPLHPDLPLPLACVAWAVRAEMARTLEDVLARRSRALFIDARVALEAAPAVAAVMQRELGRDDAWRESELATFTALAQGYMLA